MNVNVNDNNSVDLSL